MPQFYPWAKHHRADPHSLYRDMRAEHPVYAITGPSSGNQLWFITGYDEAVAALKHPDIGKDWRNKLPPDRLKMYAADADDAGSPFEMMQNNMLFLDPPDHTRLRGLVHKAFTPRMIENLRDDIQAITDKLIHNIKDDTFDLVSAFAFPLPITVIAELLGVPHTDHEQFRQWTDQMLFGPTNEDFQSGALNFVMYFHDLFDQRRAAPQDDLISALLAAEEAGEHLSREELMGMVFVLMVAGHETTVNLIGNGLLALMQHPEKYDQLQAEPEIMPTAVEEFLRYNGPVEITTSRWAFADMELGGQQINAGDAIFVALSGANHDPRMFENPTALDLTRTNNKHIAFGAGIHYCLGAPLARMEANIAFHALMTAFPRLELATSRDQLEWKDSQLLHGVKAMPVRVRR